MNLVTFLKILDTALAGSPADSITLACLIENSYLPLSEREARKFVSEGMVAGYLIESPEIRKPIALPAAYRLSPRGLDLVVRELGDAR